MLDEKTIRSLATRIEQARKTHELIRPVTAQFPEAAHPGDTFHADFGPYGSVSCHFN
jgi:2-keto-4-pentenoate hydratase